MDTCYSALAQERLSTSPASLINAFAHVIEMAGRRQVTDLHVRQLLCYVRAHDRYYAGVARSLAQLAHILVLSVPTCRRVIRRAVNEFNLLIVIPQRHNPGGQTVNRYTINWDAVDSLLLNAEITAPKNTFRAEGPAICLAQVKAAQQADGLGTNAQNDPGGLKARPFATNNMHRSSTFSPTLDDPEDLIIEDRILSSHPRLLLIPDHLAPEACFWPYPMRTRPKGTPKVLLAHIDVLLAKLQTAMDLAQQLNASNIEDRLRTLWDKLSAVQYRASHAALCRTNLPPINPIPDFSWHSTPIDYPTTDFVVDISTVPNNQCASDHAPQDQFFNNPNTNDLSPVALSDQTLSHNSSYNLNTHELPPNSPVRLAPFSLKPEAFSLLVALDELLSALTAAIQCASDHGIAWLHNRFTTLRRRIKTIRAKTQRHLPPTCANDELPPNSPALFVGAARTPSWYDLAPF